VQRAGGMIFFTPRRSAAENYQLFGGRARAADDRVLVDPNRRRQRTGHVSLDWCVPRGRRHVVTGCRRTAARIRL